MGLFRDVGNRVERFKQAVEGVAEDEAEYECAECGELVYSDRDDCPECGAIAVVARDPPTGGGTPTGEGDGGEDGGEHNPETTDTVSGRQDDGQPD
ncbi:MAG: hypothetical protein ACI9PP_001175 [Halobacteriales archaeon]|jgi:hypothetical protein